MLLLKPEQQHPSRRVLHDQCAGTNIRKQAASSEWRAAARTGRAAVGPGGARRARRGPCGAATARSSRVTRTVTSATEYSNKLTDWSDSDKFEERRARVEAEGGRESERGGGRHEKASISQPEIIQLSFGPLWWGEDDPGPSQGLILKIVLKNNRTAEPYS